MGINLKDTAAGLIFCSIGAWFIYEGAALDRGTADRMGPGFFPPVLAAILIVLGLIIIILGQRSSDRAVGQVSWRGLFLTLAAPVIFGATVQGLGLIGSLSLTTFCAAMASRRMTLLNALVITAGLLVFSVLLFVYGIGLPLPLVGSWIRI